MPCFSPLTAWHSNHINPKSGKSGIVFTRPFKAGKSFQLPCRQCIGCLLEHSRQWAIRCTHEASLHEQNSFVTLTYSPDKLPKNGSLHLPHIQNLFKSLRKEFPNKQLRYYHCGEYGDKLKRPHYHVCFFGLDFNDKKFIFKTFDGNPLYTSPTLTRLWKHGFHTIGALTFESAAYTARYIMKKQKGHSAEIINPVTALKHYEAVNLDTGEIIPLKPEYTTMSLKPAIALDWYNKHKDDVFPDDFIIHNGRKIKPPRYYSLKYQHEHPQLYEALQAQRKELSVQRQSDNTPARLKVRETVKLAQITNLKRKLHNDS